MFCFIVIGLTVADLVFPWYVVETSSACTISASVQNRDFAPNQQKPESFARFLRVISFSKNELLKG